MGEKEESKIGNQQKNQKESNSSEEKGKAYNDNQFLQEDLQIKFNEFDPQKGGPSQECFLEKEKMRILQYILKK